MISEFDLPVDLKTIIGTERVDFSVKARRNKPVKTSIFIIFFGTVWTTFTSIFVIAFLGPLFVGEEVQFTSNDVSTTASIDNFGPMLVPTLVIGLFVIVGLAMLFRGFYSLLQRGGYFVGTETRFIQYRKGNINSYDWEQFSGNIEVNSKKGDISFQLRTGKMVSRKNSSDEFVPDVIYLSGIPQVMEVEKACRKRIKENDPTPPVETVNI